MAFSNYNGTLVGGTTKKTSILTTEKTSSLYTGETNAYTVIVELYMEQVNAYTGLGLRSTSSSMNPATSHDYETYDWTTYDDKSSSDVYIHQGYDFKSKSRSNKMYVSHSSIQRKVFALHSAGSAVYIYPAHLLYGQKMATSQNPNSRACLGWSSVSMNAWVTHTDGDGNIYKSITVNSNNQFKGTTLSVKKGKRYTFNMHTVSEANFDGIIISTSSLTSGTSGSVTTAGIARCHGIDAKSTYTYTPTSDGTIYIYFKTDGSTLTSSQYNGFTTGDIEIIVEPITQVTLERNGATSGDTRLEIAYGTDMSKVSVVPPTGKPYCKFAGYYTGSSRDSRGTMYIGPSGKGVSGKTWDITDAKCTLYALYDYDPEILTLWYPLHCVYCTSSPASASTLQTRTSITLGTLGSSIDGTFSVDAVPGGANRLPSSEIQDNTTLIIPAGTASGDYEFSIRYKFTPTDTSVEYKYKTTGCDIWVISTYLVNEVMDLESLTYLEQKKDIPAGSFTLNSNNVSEYFQYPIAIPSTTQIVYNNGQTETSAPRMNWSINQPITFTSLGTTITSRQQVAIPNNSDIRLTIHPGRVYDGYYYSTRNTVIGIISSVSSGIDVGYFSRFSDLGIDDNDFSNIVKDLNSEYGITISEDKLKRVYSVDLMCKYLYTFHHKGDTVISTGSSMPIIAKYGTQTGDKVYREANIVDSLSLSVEESSIYVGDKTFADTKASFTSGDEASVSGTYSGYDSSIISIDNVIVICIEDVPDLNNYEVTFSKIYYYYGQYNGNFLFKKAWEDKSGQGSELAAEYMVTDSNDFDVLLHASYSYNGHFTTPTHIVGRLNADMSDYGLAKDVRIIDVYLC